MKTQGWVGWMLGAMMPVALAAPMSWSPVGETQHYTLTGGGDVRSADGASLTVESRPGAAEGFGGGSAVVDATPYRLQRVRLSARISTRWVEGVAGLWLRADAAAGSVAFANTQKEPVPATADDVLREVEIYVPAAADRVLLGPLLTGTGRMSVSGLRLERVPPASDDGVAPALIVDEAVRLIRAHALNAGRIQWEQEQADISRRMQQVSTPEDAYGVIRSLLGKLEDRHSGLLPPRMVQRFSSEGIPSFEPVVEVRDAVGIVSVPAFSGTDDAAGAKFARGLASAIALHAPKAACGWVVDLRGNGGGNMWPMLSGLHPLLGNATPGHVRDRNGHQSAWEIAPPGVPAPDLSAARVVVVTGAKTASSGEAVAIAFRGRPHSRSVGQPTFGVSTGNRVYPLPGGAGLKLTTTRFVDRTGRAYGDALVPDETVAEDKAIARAVAMLSGCLR